MPTGARKSKTEGMSFHLCIAIKIGWQEQMYKLLHIALEHHCYVNSQNTRFVCVRGEGVWVRVVYVCVCACMEKFHHVYDLISYFIIKRSISVFGVLFQEYASFGRHVLISLPTRRSAQTF